MRCVGGVCGGAGGSGEAYGRGEEGRRDGAGSGDSPARAVAGRNEADWPEDLGGYD